MVAERTKMLRIADTSAQGWATVLEYEQNPVAVLEEDNKKIKGRKGSPEGSREKGQAEPFQSIPSRKFQCCSRK